MRILAALLIVGAAVVPVQSLLAQQAHTTRIETKQIYGAVATVEKGVRVIRPVPPTDHLIIDPGGKTPLVLNLGNRSTINQSPWRTPLR